jgi:hypothetical protein
MFLTERVGRLMEEVGPIADLCLVDAFPADDVWQVAIDADVMVLVEVDPSRRVVVLSTELGTPAAGAREALYELLLCYSHTWGATGGMRLSLGTPGGAVWLLCDCAAQEMTAVELGKQLRSFGARARAWREIVAAHSRLLLQKADGLEGDVDGTRWHASSLLQPPQPAR